MQGEFSHVVQAISRKGGEIDYVSAKEIWAVVNGHQLRALLNRDTNCWQFAIIDEAERIIPKASLAAAIAFTVDPSLDGFGI